MAFPSVGATMHPALLGGGSVANGVSSGPSTTARALTPDSSCGVGSGPLFDAYDPVTHDLYIPNSGSANLTILTDACKLVKSLSFKGGEPIAAAFNPTNNEVYVTDYALDRVYVILGTKLEATITSSDFDGPWGIAFDPGDAVMAVANRGSDTVAFLKGTIVAFTSIVGTAPVQFAYDPYFDRFLVSNTGSNNVTSMSAIYPYISADFIEIPVGTSPGQIAFDYADSEDYVVDPGSNNVTVINSVGYQAGSISVGDYPRGAVWDQDTLTVDVTSQDDNTVDEIQGLSVIATITGPSGAGFAGISYGEATDQLYVTANSNGAVYVYGTAVAHPKPVASGTSCSVVGVPGYPAYDPVNHDVYVPAGDNLSILSGACKLVARVPFALDADAMAAAFDPANNWVYVTDYSLNQVYVLSGTKLVTTVTSTSFDNPLGVTFYPTPVASGGFMAVANYGSDTVSLIDSTSVVPIVFNVGLGPIQMVFDPYYDRMVVVNALANNVTETNPLYPDTYSNVNLGVGSAPEGVDFDYADSQDYVANSGSNSVTAVYGQGPVVGSVTVGSDPIGVAWDQAALAVYVANFGSSNLSVVQGLSVVRTITGSVNVYGIVYDEETDQVFVTGIYSGDVFVYT